MTIAINASFRTPEDSLEKSQWDKVFEYAHAVLKAADLEPEPGPISNLVQPINAASIATYVAIAELRKENLLEQCRKEMFLLKRCLGDIMLIKYRLEFE